MLKSIYVACCIAAVSAIFFMSCKSGGSKDPFSTKEDSVKFARAVYKLYPKEVTQDVDDTLVLPGNGVQPITWDTVLAYQNYYDKEPKIFDPGNKPYMGFSVDPNGYKMITSNTAIKGLYLRLGRKGDGSYTIMLLATDTAGNILQKKNLEARPAGGGGGGSTNFDNTVPCPANCPDNDD
jgi:hypothetical protein